MKYHSPCLVNAKRDIDQSKQPQSATVNFGQLLSDRQLLEIVETELNDSSKDVVMNVNDIHQDVHRTARREWAPGIRQSSVQAVSETSWS